MHPLRLSLVLVLAAAGALRADEPTKPTAAPSEKNPAVPAAGHSIHGEAFDDGPRQKAYLMPGQGNVTFPVTTNSPEAQKFINQGVGQLHSFFYFEAERSFRQASFLDPTCPMAEWGMAMANVNNARRARGFLKEAEKKAAKVTVTRRERLYLDALAPLYRDGTEPKVQKNQHLLGLETLVQEFPDDMNARAWMAMVTWQNEGQSGIGSRQAVDMVIDTVMAKEPMHPGAHHYRIHLWDSTKAIRAEKSAGMYAKTALGIAHAWHMPGHTYTNLKRYTDAAYQQEGSARVDHLYMFRDRVMPFEIHNYAHNNQWLSTSLAYIGRARDAISVARNLVEQPRDPQRNGPNDGGSSQRAGRMRWMEVLVKYEMWDDLIAATTSGALDWTEIPLEAKEKHLSLGLAYAAKGNTAKLAEESAALRTFVTKYTAASKPPANASGSTETSNRAKRQAEEAAALATSFGLALAELEGYEKQARGDFAGAIESFNKATSMRPDSLARVHLAGKNFGFAEAAAKRAVDLGPNQYLPLATLVEVLHAAGKDADAREAYKKLEPIARQADADTPIAKRLAPIIAPWKSPAPEPSYDRIDLNSVGPLIWKPTVAEPIALVDSDGKPWNLAEHKGRNVLVLFFLGGKCAHCMQQLTDFGKEFENLKKAGTDVVAISTDDAASTKALKSNKDGIKFPMPILVDPGLERYHAYRAFDDFEKTPLHGTFLIDAQGNVRFQRVSAEPFLDVDFIKKESARVQKLIR